MVDAGPFDVAVPVPTVLPVFVGEVVRVLLPDAEIAPAVEAPDEAGLVPAEAADVTSLPIEEATEVS